MIALLLGFGAPSADALLERAKTYLSGPDLSVDMALRSPRLAQPARGTLRIQGNQRMFYQIRFASQDYSLSVAPPETREVERSQRIYDVTPYVGRVTLPESRISAGTSFLPTIFFARNPKTIVPSGTQWSLAGRLSVGGVSTEVARGRFQTEMGPFVILLAIAQDGRIMRQELGPESATDRSVWTFSNYSKRPLANSAFALPFPVGFMPFSVDMPRGPISVGVTVPSIPLRGVQGGTENLNAMARRGTLVVFTRRGCEVTQRMLPQLAELRRSLGNRARVVVAADSPDAPGAQYFAPTLSRDFVIPGTPVLAWLKNGKVEQLWMGYNAAEWRTMRREIEDAVSGKEE